MTFPYRFPVYLSPILQILADGVDHDKKEIRERLLVDFPLTSFEIQMRPSKSPVSVFKNKVAFAFNRLVLHKAIIEMIPGQYRITDHGQQILLRKPTDARERDL